MNIKQLECNDACFEEQILIANLSLADPETKRRLIAVTVITAGLDVARITTGGGEIPSYAFKLLDNYMFERGFVKYRWERRLRNGKMKQVTRIIRALR